MGVLAEDVKYVKSKVDELVPLMRAAAGGAGGEGAGGAGGGAAEEGDPKFKGKKWNRG